MEFIVAPCLISCGKVLKDVNNVLVGLPILKSIHLTKTLLLP